MIIHLIHNPICAKKFVNPIVTVLNDSGIEAELWFEPWEKTKLFSLSVDCPMSFVWFDLSFNPFVFLVRLFRLSKRFTKLRPKAIHAHQTRAAFIPLLAAIFARTPIRIYHNHGAPYLGYNGILYYLLWLLEFLNCKFATHVITVSKSIRIKMIQDHIVKKTKICVLGKGSACGIDLAEFSMEQFDKQHKVKARKSFGIMLDAYVVLYVGRPFKRKGFDILLRAWKCLKNSKDKCVLLIAGCTDEDVLSNMGSSIKNVIALGYVNDLRPCYAACDAVVLPSWHEGFPYSLLEGATAGKMLIGSNISGIDSIIKHDETGILVPVGDGHALMNALITNRDDQAFRERLGVNARNMVERFFDRKLFNKTLLDYYERLGITNDKV